ncbi:hypothetical protein K504DRAFT_453984 [Pleomassaria siparia CBS 279.74]|uniref:Uncharacterized protein n=1 Tax=Pleomassaria siparia CBS 279.74 TaxID=1314801 RepID=A0A6G1KEU8_9PLEO|nr:hypothetical protein K504DRAFT_453984 [Pleomassaria siparia CBS 279.74]
MSTSAPIKPESANTAKLSSSLSHPMVFDWLQNPDPPPFGKYTRIQPTEAPKWVPPTEHVVVEREPRVRAIDMTRTESGQGGADLWQHGIVQGGIILDMIEYLRTESSAIESDQTLSHWLETLYIRPFATVNRLDGLVVRSALDMSILIHAHSRYTSIFPMPEDSHLPPRRLWVPGWEPTYVLPPRPREQVLKPVVDKAPRGVFVRLEMGGQRQGKCWGKVKDAWGWMREIWSADAPAPIVPQARKKLPNMLPPEKRTAQGQNTKPRKRNMRDGSRLNVRPNDFSNMHGPSDLLTLEERYGVKPIIFIPSFQPALTDRESTPADPFAERGPPRVPQPTYHAPAIYQPKTFRIGIIESKIDGKLQIKNQTLPPGTNYTLRPVLSPDGTLTSEASTISLDRAMTASSPFSDGRAESEEQTQILFDMKKNSVGVSNDDMEIMNDPLPTGDQDGVTQNSPVYESEHHFLSDSLHSGLSARSVSLPVQHTDHPTSECPNPDPFSSDYKVDYDNEESDLGSRDMDISMDSSNGSGGRDRSRAVAGGESDIVLLGYNV